MYTIEKDDDVYVVMRDGSVVFRNKNLKIAKMWMKRRVEAEKRVIDDNSGIRDLIDLGYF